MTDITTRRVVIPGGTTDWPPAPVLRGVPCQTIDPEIMFPAGSHAEGIKQAKAICRHCPPVSRRACGAWALSVPADLIGVWGGMSAAEIDARKRGLTLKACPGCGTTVPPGQGRHPDTEWWCSPACRTQGPRWRAAQAVGARA